MTRRRTEILKHLSKRSSFSQNVSVIAGGTAIGQAIVMLATPILTRLYSPDDFGVLALFAAFLGILSCIVSLRYELAIPLPEDDVNAATVITLCIIIILVLSINTGFAVLLVGDQVMKWVNMEELSPYLLLLPIGMFFIGLYQVFNYWAIRRQSYTSISKTRLTQAAGNAITQVSTGLLGAGAVGLIAGNVIGRAVGIITLAKGFFAFIPKVQIKSVFGMAKRYQKFPKYSSLAATINIAGAQIPVLLFAGYYGTELAGCYLLSQRMMGAPTSLIGQSIEQVFIGEATLLSRNSGHAGFYKLFIQTTKKLFMIACPLLLLIGLIAPWGSSILFGNNWVMSGKIALVLTPMYISQFVISPVSQTLTILERQDLQLYTDIIRFALGTGGVGLAAGIIHLPALVTIGIYGLSTVISYLLLGWVSIFVLKKQVD